MSNFIIKLLNHVCNYFCKSKISFIRKPIDKDRLYCFWLKQLEEIEKSTIVSPNGDTVAASTNALDIGFKLFPIIDSIALNILGKPSGKAYIKKLGYSWNEANIIYAVFRNGLIHTVNAYRIEYENGEVDWGLTSSSGSSGFTPHYAGYFDKKNPQYNQKADSAFDFTEYAPNKYHALLALDRLVAHIKYDLQIRMENDKRTMIPMVIGQRLKEKVPTPSD